MYKLHLILKYLRKRRIAWVSLIAVMLCTAMVLIVISVMGGWLRMFRETNNALVGDLIVSRQGLDGMEHYDEMLAKIAALPEVKGAAPVIRTYGLINIDNQIHDMVQVVGWDMKQIENVNGFVKSLHLQPEELKKKAAEYANSGRPEDAKAMLAKAQSFPSWDKPLAAQTYRDERPQIKKAADWPGIVIGSGFTRNKEGEVDRPDYLYELPVRLTLVPAAQGVDSGIGEETFVQAWIIDDSHTQVFLVDSHTVYLPFDTLQKNLHMEAENYTDAATGEQLVEPGRCNEIEISLKAGFTPDGVKPLVQKVVDDIVQKYGMVEFHNPIEVQTWEERQSDILQAVEHEKLLLVILFAIVSVVAVFLIFCIFFMIVVEKTRDIGIIKSVGATSWGVAGIFLGYGLTIGIIGAGLGLLMGYGVVHNINFLQDELAKHVGVKIWDAKTYVFDTVPSTMEPKDVIVIVTVAILSSVLGAVIPAIRAARLNPVEALRWE